MAETTHRLARDAATAPRALPPAPGAAPAATDAEAVRAFYAAVEANDAAALGRLLAPDWEETPAAYPGQPPGPEGYAPVVAAFAAAFADVRFELHEVIEAPGRTVVRTTVRGRHVGPFLGRAATGREVAFDTIDVHEVAGGVLRRSWHIEDFFALVRQFDAAPKEVAP